MFVNVTQVLPEGRNQAIEVNADEIEEVRPEGNHLLLLMQSGHSIEIAETKEPWDRLRQEP
jgi:hypothetical protein